MDRSWLCSFPPWFGTVVKLSLTAVLIALIAA